jgi:mutator protein MutT
MDNLLYTAKEPGLNWGTGIIIVNQGRILLGLRVDNKTWGTPGGGVDDGETPMEAIVREVKEETNLDINPLMVRFVSRNYSFNEGVVWHSFCFITDHVSGELKPKLDEFSEMKWVPIQNLYDYILFTPAKEAISEVLQYYPQYLYDIDMADETEAIVLKMTSLEQLVSVKNPGSNGGTGGFASGGNWNYKKPGSGSGQGKNLALPENKKLLNQQIKRNQQIKQLKQSYITYFQNLKGFKKVYQVKDGEFIFPDYNSAKDKELVNDKKSYIRLFKEQYVHFALTQKGGNTDGGN